LRHGFRQAVTEIALQQDLVEHRRLRVGRVEPFRLPDEAASVLLRSYRADVEIAPAHLSDWKQWAELTLLTALPPQIRAAAETIVRG